MKNCRALIVVLIIITVISLTACSNKKKCANCGKTEDEAELFLFDSSDHPGADGKYYCSACYRDVYSRTPLPAVSREIDDALQESEPPSDIIEGFFAAFDKADYQAMKSYCSLNCISSHFRDSGVYGMKRAKVTEYGEGELYKTAQGVQMYRRYVTVEMEPAEGSSLEGQTSTSFYVVFLQNAGGRWSIHELTTEIK